MRRLLLLLALVVPSLLAPGCASTSEPATQRFDTTTNETLYRARPINLGRMFENYGINSAVSIKLETWAKCMGQSCTPDQVWMGFEATGSAEGIQIGDASVTMSTGPDQFRWQERGGKMEEQDVTTVRGLFARGAVDLDELATVANAEDNVSGSLGSEAFTLSYEDREPLRRLLRLINDPS